MVAASFAEILSLGAVIPFLGVLTAPEKVFSHPSVQPIIRWLEIDTPGNLLLPVSLAFGGAALLNGGMRLFLLWSTTRLSVLIGSDLSIDMYRRTLYQPYALHVTRNSSEIINAISAKTGTTIHIILMIMNLLSASLSLLAMLGALLAVNTEIALVSMVGFGIIYLVVVHATRTLLIENSERVARETSKMIKTLQEGLGGIRDVLIDGSQNYYCRLYRQSDLSARTAQGNSGFLAGCPRYAVEALALLLISGLAYFLSREPGGLVEAIPVLGAFALGAQRTLPLMQQAYAAWAGIKSYQASLNDALELLEQPMPAWAEGPPPAPLPFKDEIRLDRLSFRYSSNTPWILNKIDIVIPRGARVGFIGPTGSGKSTLTDIIMGLLPPSSGHFRVDGHEVDDQRRRAWQTRLAHVPQSVFLADASIEENIAFGVPSEEIDHKRVRKAARQAQIAEVIEAWPEQYKTTVGERGVRLSGGQRQRIGIARALYKQADVIVLDEATSALDNETERAVMNAIDALDNDANLTIIIIAHRIGTLRGCDKIYELKQGEIAWSGSFASIQGR